MPMIVAEVLLRQLDTAWALTHHHLTGLTSEECLWRPARRGLHVHRLDSGEWGADWPAHEGYDIGPPSIAWITWHIAYWWSMVLDHSFGAGTLTAAEVRWAGSAEGVREVIEGLHARWRVALVSLPPAEWRSPARTRWPFRDRPFADVVAWATVELTKNAAEIGSVRFLRGACGGAGDEYAPCS